jgi:hypothetical protein
MKLVQKQFLKGSREFEMLDDTINVRIRTPFKEEKISVVLTVLNPEPVENGPFLEFHSRVKCGPLLSLLKDKPSAGEFKTFVDELKRRAREEYIAFAGLKSGSKPEALAGNVYQEPPDFDEPAKNHPARTAKPVNVENVGSAIQMLKQYLDAEEIEALLNALEALKEDPQKESCFDQLIKAFDDLGPRQGAVLTYAPYVGVLLSENRGQAAFV